MPPYQWNHGQYWDQMAEASPSLYTEETPNLTRGDSEQAPSRPTFDDRGDDHAAALHSSHIPEHVNPEQGPLYQDDVLLPSPWQISAAPDVLTSDNLFYSHEISPNVGNLPTLKAYDTLAPELRDQGSDYIEQLFPMQYNLAFPGLASPAVASQHPMPNQSDCLSMNYGCVSPVSATPGSAVPHLGSAMPQNWQLYAHHPEGRRATSALPERILNNTGVNCAPGTTFPTTLYKPQTQRICSSSPDIGASFGYTEASSSRAASVDHQGRSLFSSGIALPMSNANENWREDMVSGGLGKCMIDLAFVQAHGHGNLEPIWEGLHLPGSFRCSNENAWILKRFQAIHTTLLDLCQEFKLSYDDLVARLRAKFDGQHSLAAGTSAKGQGLESPHTVTSLTQAASGSSGSPPNVNIVVLKERAVAFAEERSKKRCKSMTPEPGRYVCPRGELCGDAARGRGPACFGKKDSFKAHINQCDPEKLWVCPDHDSHFYTNAANFACHMREQHGLSKEEIALQKSRPPYLIYTGERKRYCRWCKDFYPLRSWKAWFDHFEAEHSAEMKAEYEEIQARRKRACKPPSDTTGRRNSDFGDDDSDNEDQGNGGNGRDEGKRQKTRSNAQTGKQRRDENCSKSRRRRGEEACEEGLAPHSFNSGQDHENNHAQLEPHKFHESHWRLWSVTPSFLRGWSGEKAYRSNVLHMIWMVAHKNMLWCFVGCNDPMAEAAFRICQPAFDIVDCDSIFSASGQWTDADASSSLDDADGSLTSLEEQELNWGLTNPELMMLYHHFDLSGLEFLPLDLEADVRSMASSCLRASMNAAGESQDDGAFARPSRPEIPWSIKDILTQGTDCSREPYTDRRSITDLYGWADGDIFMLKDEDEASWHGSSTRSRIGWLRHADSILISLELDIAKDQALHHQKPSDEQPTRGHVRSISLTDSGFFETDSTDVVTEPDLDDENDAKLESCTTHATNIVQKASILGEDTKKAQDTATQDQLHPDVTKLPWAEAG